MMNWSLDSFKNQLINQLILVSGGGIVLVTLTLIFGRHWELNTLLLGIVVILIIWVLAMLYVYERIKAKRSAQMMEKSLKAQADEQILNTRPDKRGEIDQLKQQFMQALKFLQESKLGREHGNIAALYALPWFVVIGLPGAGKTTALLNSGLKFPYGKKPYGGVGGTKNCEWFFSDSAIFLDTAGRYTLTSDIADKEEWQAFLNLLNRYRKSRPITGVIVAVSISDIMQNSLEALEQDADRMRVRIDELIQKLGVRFPVYLALTKCDLVPGFVEYFGDLKVGEREQVWGSIISREALQNGQLNENFLAEYRQLYDVLVNRRLQRLDGSLKGVGAGRILFFPQSFRALQDKLAFFVDKLFQTNQYQESPLFRGFYFTSGTQPQASIVAPDPREFVEAEIAGEPDNAGGKPSRNKTYFLKEFFTRVILSDQHLVEPIRPPGIGWKHFSAITALLMLLALFIFSSTRAYLHNKQKLNLLTPTIEQIQKVAITGHLDRAHYELLDQLRLRIMAGQQLSARSTVWNWGLSRDRKLLGSLALLYYEKFKPFISRYIYHELRDRTVNNRAAYSRIQLSEFDRAVALMTNDLAGLTDPDNRQFLVQQMLEVLQSQTIPADMMPLLAAQVQFFVDMLGEFASGKEPAVDLAQLRFPPGE